MKSISIYCRIIVITCLLIQTVSAQQVHEPAKAQLIKEWERAKAYTKEYLDAMPADKYSFKAQDSVRSFAGQMLHLASGNVFLASTGIGKERIWAGRNLEASASAQSKDSVTYLVMTSYDYVIDGIKSLDAYKLDEKVKDARNREETRIVWIQKAFEHQTHHRGQATIYIRLVGIKPPPEKLF